MATKIFKVQESRIKFKVRITIEVILNPPDQTITNIQDTKDLPSNQNFIFDKSEKAM